MNDHRGHRQLDHTADLALEIWAPTETELLLEGASALVRVITGGARLETAREGESRLEIQLRGIDREDRLVHWLNQIVGLAVHEGFLFTGADLTLQGDRDLVARVRGRAEARAQVVTEIKGVTYHDLRLAREGPGWRARVVVDV